MKWLGFSFTDVPHGVPGVDMYLTLRYTVVITTYTFLKGEAYFLNRQDIGTGLFLLTTQKEMKHEPPTDSVGEEDAHNFQACAGRFLLSA